MKKRGQLLILLAAMLSLPLLAMAPAAAEGGSGSGGGDDSSQTTTDSSSGGSGGDTTETNQTETETETETSTNATVGELEGKAKTMLENERKDGSKHTEVERKAACKEHQGEINHRVVNYAANAQKHLDAFNAIFTKVQAFVTDKQLTVENYDSLVATVQSKQAAATQAVAALKLLNVNIDCSQSDPAQTVATIKTGVASARTALQAYRSALKDLVSAAKTAAGVTDDQKSSTGGNQ